MRIKRADMGELCSEAMTADWIYFLRAYGMDLRIVKNNDGSLSVFEAFPCSGFYSFMARGEKEPMLSLYDDLVGSIRRWLESN